MMLVAVGAVVDPGGGGGAGGAVLGCDPTVTRDVPSACRRHRGTKM